MFGVALVSYNSNHAHLSFSFLPPGMWKRHRTDASSPQHDLQKVAEVQAAEIQSLKHEKANLESNFNALKSEHDRVVNENKILKRAVTIQQERQSHASSEIEGARRFKVDAEDRIKKLEHIVLSLRYHLQTQQSNHSYDIMGFPPRPPDVY
jgi:chromosome segregation ATPase